jgi:hypothetical protein
VADRGGGEHDAEHSRDRHHPPLHVRALQALCALEEQPDAEAAEDDTDDVERTPIDGANLGHQAERRHQRHPAEWNVDQEDPAPRGVGDEQPADGGGDHRRQQGRPGEVGDRPDELGLRRLAQHDEPPDRDHQRPASALQHPGDHELRKVGAHRTQHGGEREDDDRAGEHRACAEPVRDPATHRDQDRERDQVGRDGDAQPDRRLVQRDRHPRQRGRDHGAVEVLHEERARDEQRERPLHPRKPEPSAA